MEPMRFSTGRDALDATIKRAFSIRSAAGLWKCGQGKRLDHSPTGEQKQKKRTFDVLPNPAKLISYRQSTLARRQKSRSRWGVWGRQNLCRAHPNAGQLVIGKSSSPARCAGRSRSDYAENDIQIAVVRKLQVPVVIAAPLAAKSAVLVARSYSAAFSSVPKSSAR